MSLIKIPVSHGELLDKITILEIKSEHITDPGKLSNVGRELELLESIWQASPASAQDLAGARARLKAVNEKLWKIEDRIRLREKARNFDQEFIELARAVYYNNDDRATIKREINVNLGSELMEEKSYRDYQ